MSIPSQKSFRSLLLGSLLTLACGAAPAMAGTHLDFTVLRDGDAIGHHRVDITRNGQDEDVAIKTDVVVRVAYVPVYRFEYQGDEVWRSGHLVALHSVSNEDGTHHKLQVSADAGHLKVEGDGVESQADAAMVPASLWNHDLISQSVLLNTMTGKKMAIKVADLGEDTIKSRGAAIKAHHYSITGELNRELWYDQNNTLVQVRFKAKDDSDILYVLS